MVRLDLVSLCLGGTEEELGMTQRIWVKTVKSFAEARDHDLNYYLKMSARERLEIVQYLREQYPKFSGGNMNESGKGLRRTVRVVQQA